jgi:SAM-dependent methyltransferase
VIEEFADQFWKRRALETEGSIRWTDQRMLRQDFAVIEDVLPASRGALLDLGCGTGDLFAAFLDRLEHVTAVDMVPEFIARLPENPKVHGVVSGLLAFEADRTYDVGLLFGVVNYLDRPDELQVYRSLRAAVPAPGAVVVKNQCARGDEDVVVDRVSEQIGQRYVARYPSTAVQREALAGVFDEVTVVRYPEELNPWPDTEHVAFVCR